MSWLLSPALLITTLLLAGALVHAADEEPDWEALEAQHGVRHVSEGELVFLTARPDLRILHTRNDLTVTPESLESGWVRLDQCQTNLDPVDRVEVVYRYRGMRGLAVVSSRNMDSVQVVENSIQMRGVRKGGEVCIRAEVQVLNSDGQGGFYLQSGPFHRRFLDGYFPLQLDYRIYWPDGLLTLRKVSPDARPGFAISSKPGELVITTLFEGMLVIEVGFSAL